MEVLSSNHVVPSHQCMRAFRRFKGQGDSCTAHLNKVYSSKRQRQGWQSGQLCSIPLQNAFSSGLSHSSYLGLRSFSLAQKVATRSTPSHHRTLRVYASKGPLSIPKPRIPIEVSNIITVLTTLFLVGSEPLFKSAGLTGSDLHRTVISTQAVGTLIIISLTVKSYLDLRALRDVTERNNEPSEAQAEVVDNSALLQELGRSKPSKDELKIFVTSGEGKKTKTLRLEEQSLDGARDYEGLLEIVRKIVPPLASYPLTVLYQVRQTGEFFLLEAEDDVQKLLGSAGFVYIHPSPSWE